FFTLGYGDVTPLSALGRVLAIVESGTGFGFLALVIGYLPTLSQAFSRREANIALLDARAGSPPTAAALLRRHAEAPAGPGSLRPSSPDCATPSRRRESRCARAKTPTAAWWSFARCTSRTQRGSRAT